MHDAYAFNALTQVIQELHDLGLYTEINSEMFTIKKYSDKPNKEFMIYAVYNTAEKFLAAARCLIDTAHSPELLTYLLTKEADAHASKSRKAK